MQESSRPVAAQTQLEVHGCTYSWQLQLMAVSISLLCADIIMRGCFPICCCCCRCCSLVVVGVIIQCIAVARLRLKFSCSREIIESNAPSCRHSRRRRCCGCPSPPGVIRLSRETRAAAPSALCKVQIGNGNVHVPSSRDWQSNPKLQ